MSQTNGGVGGKETGKGKEHPNDKSKTPTPKRYFAPIAAMVAAIVNCAATKQQQYEADKEWDRRWRKYEVKGIWAAAGVGLIAIVWSGWDSDRTRQVMRGQLSEMQAEQRPNLWLGTNLGTPQFILNDPVHNKGQIVWPIHLQNFGKNFIIRGERHLYLRLGDEPFQTSYGEPEKTALGVIAPGQDVNLTLISKPGYTAEDAAKFIGNDFGVVAKIVANYTDLSGAPYEASMCVEKLRSGAIMFCVRDNYIK